MSCPICKKEVEPGSPHTPFCSERCRLQDLAAWATGEYRIPAGPIDSADSPGEGEGA
jgi:uncharacterized protein